MDELNKPYYRTARAKGLSRLRTVGGHALRNASVTIATLAGWETITILAGGIIIVETVFAWPGLGLTIVQALERQDVVLLQASVFTVATMAVAINLLIDVIQKLLDPRVELN
jgi:peptide/nickel transport system permease protein